MTASALRLASVGKTYTMHGAAEAIRSIDLDVRPGELVGVIGPRACGTSTLLAMIAGFELPTRGRITADGRRVRTRATDRVLVGSDTGLLPWLDARRNVELALRERRLPEFERAALARRALDLVSLHRFATTPAGELSLAHQHRVALARALVTAPTLLLMDDPYRDLDAKNRAALNDELLAVWTATRTTIVFVAHDPIDAVMLADRIILLSPQPSRVIAEIAIDLPRPRRRDDADVRAHARDLMVGVRAAAA